MKILWTMAIGVCVWVSLILTPGHAQALSFTCTLQNGQTVRLVQDVTLNNIAVARMNVTGPVIVVNLAVLKKFSLPTQLFWLSHECAHQKLGHFTVRRSTARDTKEQQADCQGAKDMVMRFRIDSDQLRIITTEVSKVGRGRGGLATQYMTGPERAQLIANCAVQAAQR